MKTETTSIAGSELMSESLVSFGSGSMKFPHHKLFHTPKTDVVLPELSYFTNSMPLMSLNSNNLYARKEKKRLPKLSSSSHHFSVQNSKSDP